MNFAINPFQIMQSLLLLEKIRRKKFYSYNLRLARSFIYLFIYYLFKFHSLNFSFVLYCKIIFKEYLFVKFYIKIKKGKKFLLKKIKLYSCYANF